MYVCIVAVLAYFCTLQTESCLPNLGHLVVTSDTSGLPDN